MNYLKCLKLSLIALLFSFNLNVFSQIIRGNDGFEVCKISPGENQLDRITRHIMDKIATNNMKNKVITVTGIFSGINAPGELSVLRKLQNFNFHVGSVNLIDILYRNVSFILNDQSMSNNKFVEYNPLDRGITAPLRTAIKDVYPDADVGFYPLFEPIYLTPILETLGFREHIKGCYLTEFESQKEVNYMGACSEDRSKMGDVFILGNPQVMYSPASIVFNNSCTNILENMFLRLFSQELFKYKYIDSVKNLDISLDRTAKEGALIFVYINNPTGNDPAIVACFSLDHWNNLGENKVGKVYKRLSSYLIE